MLFLRSTEADHMADHVWILHNTITFTLLVQFTGNPEYEKLLSNLKPPAITFILNNQ